jgi:phosphotransferase system HPr (HPr) family protein
LVARAEERMKKISFTIKNPVWMHPGTAVSFTMKMEKFSSSLIVSRGGESRNGKDFYELMKLRNRKGDVTSFKAEGPDEDALIDSVTKFINDNKELS